jgi:hypothetical protein
MRTDAESSRSFYAAIKPEEAVDAHTVNVLT